MSTDREAFYSDYVRRTAQQEEDRLVKIVASIPSGPGRLLDMGCGQGRNLQYVARHRADLELIGTDIAEQTPLVLQQLGFRGVHADATGELPFQSSEFDVVICGEIIEHVSDPDFMLKEIGRILRPGGTLILTTPNLAYVPNRLLLLLGIQPLFTETSVKQNLGRRFALLGQGGATQGHLKIFTLPAISELLALEGFIIDKVMGYRFFQRGVLCKIDALLALRPSFAAGFVLVARRPL